MRRIIGTVGLGLLLVGLTAGCSSGPDYTAKGTVVSKDADYECETKAALGTVAVAAAPVKTSSPTTKPVKTSSPTTKPKGGTKKTKRKPGTCGWDWEVDVKQADGSVVEEDVAEQHYNLCDAGEKFPDCTRG